MGFELDKDFESDVGTFFGEYVSTFYSNNKQVWADLFKEGEGLVAHVSFAKGFTSGSISDPYLSDLNRFAEESGYGSSFRLVMSGS